MTRLRQALILCLMAMTAHGPALAQQQTPSTPSTPPAKAPAAPAKTPPPISQTAPKQGDTSKPVAPQTPDPNAELQRTVQEAGSDSAKLVKNLEAYLVRYPDTPQLPNIYRALAESEMRLKNEKAALGYAEKLIAIQPSDTEAMYLAVTVLSKMPDDASLAHAVDYDSRLIDSISKANPAGRPPQMSLEEWQAGRNKFTMNLYEIRGRMQKQLHKTDEAVKDLTESYQLLPNAGAAVILGEIAEERKQNDEAVRQYSMAFLLYGQDPQQDPQEDDALNRDALRAKMGKIWRLSHDSDAGLGDLLLATFDKMNVPSKPATPAKP